MNAIKLVLGGFVALVSAFGMTIAVLFALAITESRSTQKATGLGAVAGGFTMILHSGWFWVAVLVTFAIGFFLTYRKLYF
jgi:hypothetical protein